MGRPNKQFYVEFDSSVTDEQQRQALQNLLGGFDQKNLGASFMRVEWVVSYEDYEESIQGNITFDPASTQAEKVVDRWKKKSGRPTVLSGKETLAEGDHMVSASEFFEGREAKKVGMNPPDCPYLGVEHGEKRMPQAAWMYGWEVEAKEQREAEERLLRSRAHTREHFDGTSHD